MNIASVASAGEVTPSAAGLDVAAETPGDATIADGAVVDVSSDESGGGGSGHVYIRGGGIYIGNGGQIKADATGAENGGVKTEG